MHQRMIFPGERGECCGDLVEAGADVGGCGRVGGVVAMPGVAPGHGVAEVPFNPGEGRMPEPVDTDLLGRDPCQVLTDAFPQVIISAMSNWVAVAIAEKLSRPWCAALLRVKLQMGHEGR